MNNIVQNIVATSKGWLLRQALKWGASAGASVSALVVGIAANANIEPSQAAELAAQSQQITAGLVGLAVSLGVAMLETWLSKKASKIVAQ